MSLGTDSLKQLEEQSRLHQPAPVKKQPTPSWTPLRDRKVRTAVLLSGSNFSPAGCTLTRTPAGMMAIFGGKVVTHDYWRYYYTQLPNLDWVPHGSTAAKTIHHVKSIHGTIWSRKSRDFRHCPPGPSFNAMIYSLTIPGIQIASR
ncbi:hypothetical protein F4818DRAFT_122083 [Hypoxylon cercidicola]|nr:hypothetical protein F4818DRAFT_122083 [Hypoxylon cercidicola]